MCVTNHTVPNSNGQAVRVSAQHTHPHAIQYDFYIPGAIWSQSEVINFLSGLSRLAPGATIFHGLIGVWQGVPEETCIYRLIVEYGEYDRNNLTSALRSEIGNLMARLSVTASSQEAIMFTETNINMSLSNIQ